MPVLRYTPLLALGAWSVSSFAVGLGPLNLESGLGQPLVASVPLYEPGKSQISARCIKARVESVDGVFISNLQVDVPDARPLAGFSLASRQIINEPAVTVFVEFDCGDRIRRSYQSILDFPASTSTLAAVGQKPIGSGRSGKASGPSIPVDNPQDDVGRPEESASGGRSVRQPRLNSPAPGGRQATVESRASARKNADEASGRAVLKLSSGSNLPVAPMKMSDVLSPVSAYGNAPAAAPTEEMLLARRNFAALLAGEDLLSKATREISDAQRQLRDADTNTSALTKKSESQRLAFEDLDRKSFSAIWVAALSGTLLFSLGTIGWLVHRLRKTEKSVVKWWEGGNHFEEHGVEQRSPSAGDTSHDFATDMSPASIGKLWPSGLPSGEIGGRKEPAMELQESAGMMRSASSANVIEFESLSLEANDSGEPAFMHSVGGMPFYQGKMLKVEEVSDIVQEAEFWMLLNDPQRAVQILEPHASSERPDSPVAWLYLIDLYRILGDSEKYGKLSERFKRIFNARIPKWEEQNGEAENASLEDFPGLLNRIVQAWGDNGKAISLLESLLIDDRDGERIGFDLPVYREIIMLIGIANETARMTTR